MRFLILDDNSARLDALASSLRAGGFSVMAFTCPHEALKNIQEADVLVTDHRLPEMNGLEVARRAYAQGWRGSLFIMSGDFGGHRPPLHESCESQSQGELYPSTSLGMTEGETDGGHRPPLH